MQESCHIPIEYMFNFDFSFDSNKLRTFHFGNLKPITNVVMQCVPAIFHFII